MDKEVVYITEYYSAIKMTKTCICNNIDEPQGNYISMSERERQILYDLTYMWNLKKQNKTKQNTKPSSQIKRSDCSYQR